MAIHDVRLRFGSFQFVPGQVLLLRGEMPVHIGSRALAILGVLLKRPGEVISNETLLQKVWPDTFVDEANLRVHLVGLRKALREDSNEASYIVNEPGRGYRFAGIVNRVSATGQDEPRVFNLPPNLVALVGRDEVIHAISSEFLQRRFVTILGPGGIGKTSVAIAAAQAMTATYRDGVCFVDLAPLREPERIPGLLRVLVGRTAPTEKPKDDLVDYLCDKEMLLVLDNCEHLLEGVAELAARLLTEAPHLHILTTSREPLRIEGETIQRLESLPSPDTFARSVTAKEAMQYPAIKLFCDRARMTLDSFEVTDDDVPSLALLCRRLDGNPLAIELAAARVDLFDISSLTSQLTGSLSLLSKGRRGSQPRHRALQATMDWSYDLLPDHEKLLLARLSLFRGSFSRSAVFAIVAGDDSLAEVVDEGLAALAAKSLIVTTFSSGHVSYRLLDTTRVYATGKAQERSDRADVCRRHASYYTHVLQATTEVDVSANSWITQFGGMLDDVRSALDWAFSTSGEQPVGLDLIAASANLWIRLFLHDEYMSRLEGVLRSIEEGMDVDPRLELRVTLAFATTIFSIRGPASELMPPVLNKALSLAEGLGDRNVQARALWMLYSNRSVSADGAGALAFAERFSVVAAGLDSKAASCMGHRITSFAKFLCGDFAGSRLHAEEAIDPVDPIPEYFHDSALIFDHTSTSMAYLAQALWMQGLCVQAARVLDEAISRVAELDDQNSLCYILSVIGLPMTLWSDDRPTASRYLALLSNYATTKLHPWFLMWAKLYQEVLTMREADSSDLPAMTQLQLARSGLLQRQVLATLVPSAAKLVVQDPSVTNETWCSAEILRIEGIALLQHKKESQRAEGRLRLFQAKQLASRQGALMWELRATSDLASLMLEDGQSREAREILMPVTERFSEGYTTADFRRASELLDGFSDRSLVGSDAVSLRR